MTRFPGDGEVQSSMIEHIKAAKYEMIIEAGPQGLLLPPYKGSTLRGGFGQVFQQIVCAQRGQDCKVCLLGNTCPYKYIFETTPPPGAEMLRNYQDIPRPFVLEPPLDTKTDYEPGEKLSFNLVLFGRSIQYLPYFLVTFRELGSTGIGKGRRPFKFRSVYSVNELNGERRSIYADEDGLVRNVEQIITGEDILNACNIQTSTSRAMVRFLSMTRLKFEDHFVNAVEFHVLIRNLLRRMSSLSYFHHDQEMEADFPSIIEKAQKVSIVHSDTHWVDWERYSSRQDSRMNLGGVVGDVTYEGDLAEFLPLLLLGQWTHVGKAVTFGMGKIEVALG
ncbi:MAG: CRISPR system precrRNA processing endoribonuclease RAMP protein Cas6 [Bacillota bacterium]